VHHHHINGQPSSSHSNLLGSRRTSLNAGPDLLLREDAGRSGSGSPEEGIRNQSREGEEESQEGEGVAGLLEGAVTASRGSGIAAGGAIAVVLGGEDEGGEPAVRWVSKAGVSEIGRVGRGREVMCKLTGMRR
jgi:hypothetical protein